MYIYMTYTHPLSLGLLKKCFSNMDSALPLKSEVQEADICLDIYLHSVVIGF